MPGVGNLRFFVAFLGCASRLLVPERPYIKKVQQRGDPMEYAENIGLLMLSSRYILAKRIWVQRSEI